jgi:hypothetical protein
MFGNRQNGFIPGDPRAEIRIPARCILKNTHKVYVFPGPDDLNGCRGIKRKNLTPNHFINKNQNKTDSPKMKSPYLATRQHPAGRKGGKEGLPRFCILERG